jgi:hypothetical protein
LALAWRQGAHEILFRTRKPLLQLLLDCDGVALPSRKGDAAAALDGVKLSDMGTTAVGSEEYARLDEAASDAAVLLLGLPAAGRGEELTTTCASERVPT